MGRILHGLSDKDFVAMVSQVVAGLASASEEGPIILPGQHVEDTEDKSFFSWMTFASPDSNRHPVCLGILAFTGAKKELMKTALSLDVGVADIMSSFDPKWANMRMELAERNMPGGVGEKGNIICPHCGFVNDADVVGIFSGVKVCQKKECGKTFTLMQDMAVEAARRYGKSKRQEVAKDGKRKKKDGKEKKVGKKKKDDDDES